MSTNATIHTLKFKEAFMCKTCNTYRDRPEYNLACLNMYCDYCKKATLHESLEPTCLRCGGRMTRSSTMFQCGYCLNSHEVGPQIPSPDDPTYKAKVEEYYRKAWDNEIIQCDDCAKNIKRKDSWEHCWPLEKDGKRRCADCWGEVRAKAGVCPQCDEYRIDPDDMAKYLIKYFPDSITKAVEATYTSTRIVRCLTDDKYLRNHVDRAVLEAACHCPEHEGETGNV